MSRHHKILGHVALAPDYVVSVAGDTMLSPPHHAVIRLNVGWDFRITDCRCAACERDGQSVLALELVTATALLEVLLREDIGALELLLPSDLWLPTSNGEPCELAPRIEAYADALTRGGVTTRLLLNEHPPVGTWVRTVGYRMHSPDNIIVSGLLGQVTHDAGGVCTPGVSLMVKLEGRDGAFGYWRADLELLTSPPAPHELEASRTFDAQRLALLEQAHGPTGLLDLGKGRLVPADRASEELEQLVRVVAGESGSPSAAQLAGNIKRIRRILRTFAASASDAEAAQVAEADVSADTWHVDVRRCIGRMQAWTAAIEAEE
jgi:hypothetical protein